jgi:ribonuclease T1
MVAMAWTRIALLAIAVVVFLAGCIGDGAGPGASASAGAPTAPTGSRVIAGATAPAGMATVTVADLPPEAAATLLLIAAGGPFPYRQDGVTFENRERLLPPRPTGFYREFTVPTPGSSDRGARRIITGANGERYWTADHYDSFAWITP